MKLQELFDRTIDWEWLRGVENPFHGMGRETAGFTIKDVKYYVTLGKIPLLDDVDTHMMGFAARVNNKWEEDELGTGNELLVFSTVMEIIGDYLNRKSPEVLLLGAKPHRERLYIKFMKRRNKELANIGYIPYGKIEERNFPPYGHVVLLPLVRKDKLDEIKDIIEA